MRWGLGALLAAIPLTMAGCISTVVPLPSATSSPTSPPSPSPVAALPSPSLPRPGADVMTDQVGDLGITHPTAWALVPGPPPVTGPATGYAVPLFYLSTSPLDVVPCPSPDPTTHVFAACRPPLRSLPDAGVLVTVAPNLGLPAFVPPKISTGPASDGCLAVGGDAEVDAVVGAIVISTCLRGPGLGLSEAEARAMIGSITGASGVSATPGTH